MGACKCPEAEITSTDWHERFRMAKCKCNHDGRLYAAENGRKIIICGDSYNKIDKVKVDGGLICDKGISKCDYFFGHRPNKLCNYANSVFVELKGCDIQRAHDQIIRTIAIFRSYCKLTKVNGVIVCSKVPKSGGKELKVKTLFKRDTGGTLHIKETVLKYDIVNNRIAN